jgi:TonB family protein
MARDQIQTSNRTSGIANIICFILAAALATLFSTAKPLCSQSTDEMESHRRVIRRVEPEYPETLKRLYIGGVLRVETTVAANGAVENAELLGGNPVLGQSAMKAIKQWKYAPTNSKEKLIVKLNVRSSSLGLLT